MLKSESTNLSKAYIKSKGSPSRCDGLRELDAFSVPIHLFYQGASAYRTMVGAVATLVLCVFLLFFIEISVMRLYNSLNPTISLWYQHDHNNSNTLNLNNKAFHWSLEMSAVLVESKDQDRWNELKPIDKIEPRFGSLNF